MLFARKTYNVNLEEIKSRSLPKDNLVLGQRRFSGAQELLTKKDAIFRWLYNKSVKFTISFQNLTSLER